MGENWKKHNVRAKIIYLPTGHKQSKLRQFLCSLDAKCNQSAAKSVNRCLIKKKVFIMEDLKLSCTKKYRPREIYYKKVCLVGFELIHRAATIKVSTSAAVKQRQSFKLCTKH